MKWIPIKKKKIMDILKWSMDVTEFHDSLYYSTISLI